MLPLGQVGGAGPPCRGGDSGGGSGVVLLRCSNEEFAVFFSEFLLHVGWGWGWGFTTATFGEPGRGGGGGRAEILGGGGGGGGGGGKLLFSVGAWGGKCVLACWC